MKVTLVPLQHVFLHIDNMGWILFWVQLQGQSPPAPIRFNKKASAEEDVDEVDGEQEEDGGQDAMDLLPRTDVG